jgi:cytochrome d ubiquinol oxidase subunit II
MADIWYLILAGMLTGFAILAGWDFGAGALHGWVARDPREKRAVIRAIGPLWTWNEVWLIASGGTLLCAFPAALGAAFSGFYLAMHVVLWCLLLRGLALEFRSHLADGMWQGFWDAVFPVANLLLALLFSTAFGALVRGLPLRADPGALDGSCDMPLFTTFTPYGQVGVLDWYTVAVGLLGVLLLLAHGAAFLHLRADGAVRARARTLTRRLWPVVAIALAGVTVATFAVRPDLGAALARPLCWLAALAVAAGATAIIVATWLGKDRPALALAGSSLVIAGLLGGAFAAIHPELIHSTLSPGATLTIATSATPDHGLALALMWWPFAAILSVAVYALNRRWHAQADTLDLPVSGAAD